MVPRISLKYTPGETERTYGIRVSPEHARKSKTVEVIVSMEVPITDADGNSVMEVVAAPLVATDRTGNDVNMLQPVTRPKTLTKKVTYTFRDDSLEMKSQAVNVRVMTPSVAKALASVGLGLDVRECDGTVDGYARAQTIQPDVHAVHNVKTHASPLAHVMLSKPERRALERQQAAQASMTTTEAVVPSHKSNKARV